MTYRSMMLASLLSACSAGPGLKTPTPLDAGGSSAGSSGGTLIGAPDAASSGGGSTSGGASAGSSAGSASDTFAACVAPIALADISTPTTTISDCSFASLQNAVAKGGVIVFACTGTVTFTETLTLKGNANTTIDGGGTVILDGGAHQMFTGISTAPDPTGEYFRDSDVTFTLQRLTLQNAAVCGTKQIDQTDTNSADNCSTGYTDGTGGVLSVNNLTVHVIDCTFKNNSAEPRGPDVGGGAIYALGSKDVSIVGSTFTGNTAANGGALGSLQSNLHLVGNTFSGNQAVGFGANGNPGHGPCPLLPDGQYQTGSGGNGGAIAIDGGESNADGSPTVTMCGNTFINNSAGAFGGAVFRTPDVSEQETDIDQSVFQANQSVSGGGALYFHNSFLHVDATLFDGNTSQGTGGAVFTDTGNPSFTNSTFTANDSALFGGAMVLFGCSAGAPCTLQNCTFAANTATLFGAALGGDAFAISDTIFANNAAPNPQTCQNAATGADNLQWPASSGNDPACVTGITAADPLLGALANNGGPSETLLPAAASPAIGAGASCSDHDQRLQLRESACTIGAVEVAK